ncbi:hypothetical protein M0804_010210 [Polistes exclamans]|nr:hypothetical protein M0804_010210 [Polistes exclamans]
MHAVKVEYTEEANMMDSVPTVSSSSSTTTASQQQQQQQGVPFDENSFEPQTRARSNTWPLPRPEGYVEGNVGVGGAGASGACGTGAQTGNDIGEAGTPPQQSTLGQGAGSAALFPVKKNSSRRNAWGNLSYADLITQAITSAPEQRLTLSQIYEWMVQNVHYFKDKGDSNSSAGWKFNYLGTSLEIMDDELSFYVDVIDQSPID